MARAIRTHNYLQNNNIDTDTHYDKQIYVRNATWHPPPAPLSIEDEITDFEKAIKRKQQALELKYKKRNLSNLTPLQTKVLHQLQ
jgi:hypothetical protein